MGENKKNQMVIGFALETKNEEVNAKAKMITKNLDAIILNVLHQENEVFNSDKNEITIFHKDGRQVNFKKQSKLSLAHEIFKQIL
jgi:phosphopantothenoylcysteine decarboxylase/phosphopantothenate--cysteine ligase